MEVFYPVKGRSEKPSPVQYVLVLKDKAKNILKSIKPTEEPFGSSISLPLHDTCTQDNNLKLSPLVIDKKLDPCLQFTFLSAVHSLLQLRESGAIQM